MSKSAPVTTVSGMLPLTVQGGFSGFDGFGFAGWMIFETFMAEALEGAGKRP